MELKWKTRGGAAPRDKSRVYFCCHEADFHSFFEPISRDILQLQDCAIWYRDTLPAVDDEEYIAQLQQMQLFVMPVTTRLLTTANAALDIDFPIAQREHIPVLPLMQESGLEALFNAKCGTLQFLDKHAQDATALKFEDKLQRYLDAVLVGDAQAAKIRAAFDAYIFLSYRKKDRKYAQALMRLIHQNDFARDIAIWYDEFLTPGEDFNDAIGTALDQSALYALTVTPNLLEQGNYIMAHEYPAALNSGKPILPVEMLSTDRASLEQVYIGLPDSIAQSDQQQLTAALTEALQTIALRQNDADPEHNFFIGLAYLGGIDVERDPERAAALITSAAEAGLPEAMDKLMSMYENGDGVTRDYRQSVYWQEQLTEHRRKVWENTGDWHDGDDYAYELKYLAASYQELRMETQAAETAQTLYDLALDKDWGWDHRYYAAVILGDIARENRRPEEAERWYKLGLETALEQGDKAYRGQILMYNRLSMLADDRNDEDAARSYSEAFLTAAKKRCQTKDARGDMIVALLNLATAWKNQQVSAQAVQYAQQALELAQAVAQEQPSRSADNSLSLALSICASCHVGNGDYDTARELIRQSIDLQQKAVEDTGSISDRSQLMQAYNVLCSILLHTQQPEQALTYSDAMLALAESIRQEADTAESRRQLGRVMGMRARIYLALNRPVDAQAATMQSLALTETSRESYADLVNTMAFYCDLAQAMELREDPAAALPYYEQALELGAQCKARFPSAMTDEHLFVYHNNLALCLAKLEQPERMCEQFQKALSCAEAVGDALQQDSWLTLSENYIRAVQYAMEQDGETSRSFCESYLRICGHLPPEQQWGPKLRNNVAIVLHELARLEQNDKRDAAAIAYHRRHIPLRRQLLNDTGLSYHRSALADSLYDLGQLLEGSSEALEYYEQALPLYRQVQQEEPALYHLYRISYCCTMLGRHAKATQQWQQAEALYTEGVDAACQLAEQSDKSGDRRRYATTLADLGDLYLLKGAPEHARPCFQTARDLYTALDGVSGFPDSRSNAAIMQTKLGECAAMTGNTADAIEQMTAAAGTLKQLMHEDNNAETRLNYTACLERLAQVYRSCGADLAARDCIDIIVPLREQNHAEDGTLTTALQLAQTYQNAFIARGFSGDALGAADACDKNIDLLTPLTESHPELTEPLLAVAYHSRSILCAAPEDERWCLEQAAPLAAKYPNDPGCKNVLVHLPEDLQPKAPKKPGLLRGLFGKT